MQQATDLPALLQSETNYQDFFFAGLERLLEPETLNLFILVCANASFDPALFLKLKNKLKNTFDKHTRALSSALIHGDVVNATDDDMLVFLKMAHIGFDALQLTQWRQADCWEIQFNHLRSFRPGRNAVATISQNQAPFIENGFSFNLPFFEQEKIWNGLLCGRSMSLYYNKFPFVENHTLLVPEREQCHPQWLDESMFMYVWELAAIMGEGMPGMRIGYNAMGAYASVNHLHFQMSVRQSAYPIEQSGWHHNGGNQAYPSACYVFDEADAAWIFLAALHAKNHTYNLLFSPGKIYCLPRQFQGAVELPGWSPGFSWYEMCGGFVTSQHPAFESLSDVSIKRAMSRFML